METKKISENESSRYNQTHLVAGTIGNKTSVVVIVKIYRNGYVDFLKLPYNSNAHIMLGEKDFKEFRDVSEDIDPIDILILKVKIKTGLTLKRENCRLLFPEPKIIPDNMDINKKHYKYYYLYVLSNGSEGKLISSGSFETGVPRYINGRKLAKELFHGHIGAFKASLDILPMADWEKSKIKRILSKRFKR